MLVLSDGPVEQDEEKDEDDADEDESDWVLPRRQEQLETAGVVDAVGSDEEASGVSTDIRTYTNGVL